MNKTEMTTAESSGFLLDGETPIPVDVKITPLDTGLRFTQSLQHKSHVWGFSDIDWESTSNLHGQLRLKKREEDVWLVVTSPVLIHEINNGRKQWGRRNFWATHPDLRLAVLAGLGILTSYGCLWFGWPLLTKPIAALVPDYYREWLGKGAQHKMDMDNVCTDQAGQTALDSLATRLSAGHPALRHIQVVPVQSPMINAFTLANDKVLLTSAIIKQAASPDEIAGILAHEFGHVVHQHVLRGMLGEYLMQALTAPFTGPVSEEVDFTNVLTNNVHSRDFEAEADETATALLADAKISSHGLAQLFKRIGQQKNSATNFTRYFDDHPPVAEREQRVINNTLPDATPALSLQDWRNLQQMCGVQEEPAAEQQHKAQPPAAD